MFEEKIEKCGFWSAEGPYSDVVLSSRIRLARNIPGFCFPNKLEKRELEEISIISKKFVSESCFSGRINYIQLKDLENSDKRFLRERNIITHEMENFDYSAIIIEKDDKFNILINEEDHFRIQVILSGFQIMEAYRIADIVDDEFNKFISYAFSEELGFLTACPSNIGTGIRASTMVHLPALSVTKRIPEIVDIVKKFDFLMKGTYNTDYKTIGNLYIISNRTTLGLSEIDIIEKLDAITTMVIDAETEARDSYISDYGQYLDDRVWRSFGILKYSKNINFIEAMEHLSNIRLGVILSIIKNFELMKINNLMVNIQQSHLQKIANRIFTDNLDCDRFRAEYLDRQLN